MRSTAAESDPDAGAPDAAVYWNIRDIQFHCRIGRSTAWRLVREEGFPAPVLYGKRCVLWPRVEVMEFLEARRQLDHYSRKKTSPTRSEVPDSAFVPRPIRTRTRSRPA